ncbi:RNA polymerase subunit sigma-70, partial [Alistipes onderdonkii]
MLRFARLLRLTNTMKEFEFTRYVVPLRDRMFRYAQSLLLCADEAEDVTHDLLERLWTERGRLDGCRDIASFVMAAVR